MKTMEKNKVNKNKKQKMKKKPILKPKKEQVMIVAQEIKFARLLSGNEKKTRDRVLKALKKWLINCFQKKYEFKEEDFVRIWKGLFYAVWMSDKPLVQEDLCESIAGILDMFPVEQIHNAMLMVKAGLRVLATEWYGIDQHRMDKFLMLVRRYLRGAFRCLLRCEWSLDACKSFTDSLTTDDGLFSLKTPAYARNATSLLLHIIDCYLEELAKVCSGKIPEESVLELFSPFCRYMCGGETPSVCHASRRLLTALLKQSDAGLVYSEKTNAWKKMGCPAGGPDALELASDDETDDETQDGDDEINGERALDPRAGCVDVILTPVPVPARALASTLRALLPAAPSTRAHTRARICLQRFEQLAKGEYPLKEPDVRGDDDEDPSPSRHHPAAAARALLSLEKSLVAASDELALRGLSRKHRKRLLAKSRAGVSIADEAPLAPLPNSVSKHKTPNNCTNGQWHVEDAQPENKRIKKNNENDSAARQNKRKNKKNKKRKLDDKADENNIKKQKTNAVKEKPHLPTVKLNNSVDEKQKHKKPINGLVDNKKVKNKETVKNKDIKRNQSKLKPESVKEIKKPEVTAPVNGVQKPKKEIKLIFKDKNLKPLNIITNKKPENSEVKTNKVVNDKKNELKCNKGPTYLVNKLKKFHKQTPKLDPKQETEKNFRTPKRVKFVLKNNSMQGPVDYYKSVRQSPSIPYDGTKQPAKTNLKPCTPSPINPFFKKKLKLKH